ncbi:MAG: hypothetical protein CL575_01640 [Altererythrobacter sp.]|nr:hypothetical protein [Altererythrobacter sp.]|tara:strand:- start:8575 stop:10584 length:2010 start_codon:yes stop_codon:yes gene_type:complete
MTTIIDATVGPAAIIDAGENAPEAARQAAIATAAAEQSQVNASISEAYSNKRYDTLGEGEAETAVGVVFLVWNGDDPRTYTPYQRTVGGSAVVSPLATTSSLAAPEGSSFIGFKRDAAGSTAMTQQFRNELEVWITDFGAKFDLSEYADPADATDDLGAWNLALAYLGTRGGGKINTPHGASKVTAQLNWPNVPISVKGSGRRKIYPGKYIPGTPVPSTLVPIHTGRAAIQFAAATAGHGMLTFEDFNLATLEEGDVPTAAFGWDTAAGFHYGTTFHRVGIHGFTSAFEVYKVGVGSEFACGAVKVEDCVINRNQNCWRHFNGTYVNGLTVRDNKSGQNTAGWDATGPNLLFEGNIMETMTVPITMNGQYRGHIAKGNYFEGNSGPYCVKANGSISAEIGPNNYVAITTTHKAWLQFVESYVCVDPFWSGGCHKGGLPQLGNTSLGNLSNDSTDKYLRIDRFEGANYSNAPRYSAIRQSLISANQVRAINPQTGNPMVAFQHTTAGNGSLVAVNGALAGAVGNWVIACWAFRRIPDGGTAGDPFLQMFANTSQNQTDHAIFRYTRCWADGEWTLVTAAMKLTVAMSTVRVLLYPYGVNPTEGRVSHTNIPDVYVIDDINKVRPFFDNKNAETISAPPTGGTWVIGDQLRRAAGGTFNYTATGWQSVIPA